MTIKAKVFKLGSHAVTLCDVIHPEVDEDGCPQFALLMGQKVHISSVEPLMVRNLEGSSLFANLSIPVYIGLLNCLSMHT